MSAKKRCAQWLDGIEYENSLQAQYHACGNPPGSQSPPNDSAIDETLNPSAYKRRRMEASNAMPKSSDKQRQKRRANDPDDDIASSTRSYASGVSSKRSRPSSPNKSSIALQTNRMKAEGKYEDALLSGLDTTNIPPSLATLLSDLRDLADGSATLPTSLRPQIERHGDINARRTDLWHNEASDLTWREVSILVEAAQSCRLRNDHEAGWNSFIHGPLLTLACCLSGVSQHVKPINLSQIRPEHRLLPFGPEIRKTMVDFGLVIHVQEPLLSFYHSSDFPQSDVGIKTWNHTTGQQLAHTPLVVSMEIKRDGDKNEEAQLQLGTWVTAHLKRMLELRRTTSEDDIFLPQIKIQGANWFFMLVRGKFDATKAGSGDNVHDSLRVTLFNGFEMGDVTSYSGFFRVLSCLKRIVIWIHEVYRPWLEDWVQATQNR